MSDQQPLQVETGDLHTRRTYRLSERLSDVVHDIDLSLGRLNEALELLSVWAKEHPEDGLARASHNLIKRCQETP